MSLGEVCADGNDDDDSRLTKHDCTTPRESKTILLCRCHIKKKLKYTKWHTC